METFFPTIFSAIVSALLAAYSAYSATKKAAEERERQRDALMAERYREQSESIARLETKVDLLSDRVDKHNNLIERTYRLEADVHNMHELLKVGGTE